VRYIFKIDKDNKIAFDTFREEYPKIIEAILKLYNLKLVDLVIKESPSKRGYHIWVHAEGDVKLTDLDIAKIQYFLGDDETRTYLNIMRIKRGITFWNKMFSEIIWKRPEDFQLKKCEEILKKENLTNEERAYVFNYLNELFLALSELKEKIKEISNPQKL